MHLGLKKIDQQAKLEREKIERNIAEYAKFLSLNKIDYTIYDYDGSLSINGQIKNAGPKTITVLDIMLYGLDKSGNKVFERPLYVVFNYGLSDENGSSRPLKPNYSIDFIDTMEKGEVPSDFSGKFSFSITRLEFSKDK
jgi:hypothetical protein